MVLFGFKTLRAGDRALLRNHRGEAVARDGPARLTLWRTEMEILRQFRAGQGEYLEVQGVVGKRTVLPGPCSM